MISSTWCGKVPAHSSEILLESRGLNRPWKALS
jgi:hypothetical protein